MVPAFCFLYDYCYFRISKQTCNMKFKPVLTAIALLCICTALSAVPAKRGILRLAQPDGSVLRVRIIGDRSRLDPDLQESIAELEDFSKDMDGLNFQVALNYGSRDEILRGINKIVADIKSGVLKDDIQITDDIFEEYLDTAGIPAPDLLIRTSGEQRLSNFFLWQLAYTEFYFTDVYWPDFDEEELKKAIEAYNGRDRRYGGV